VAWEGGNLTLTTTPNFDHFTTYEREREREREREIERGNTNNKNYQILY
jgi:hypothetical protein